MPKKNPPVVIELTRKEAYRVIHAFRMLPVKETKTDNAAFAKVEDAICRYDDAKRQASEVKHRGK